MRMPLSVTSDLTRWRGVALSERIELLKWVAVLLMLADHSKYLGVQVPGWPVLGRGAFPLFALAVGYALSVAPDSRGFLLRLLCGGFIAEAFGAWHITSDGDLNVLFSFALAAWLVHARRAGSSPVRWFLKVGAAALLAELTEYGIAGVVLTLASYWYWQQPGVRRIGVPLAASLLLVVPNYSFLGTWWLAAGFLLLLVPVGLPRVKRAFYVVYVAQWPVLWVLS